MQIYRFLSEAAASDLGILTFFLTSNIFKTVRMSSKTFNVKYIHQWAKTWQPLTGQATNTDHHVHSRFSSTCWMWENPKDLHAFKQGQTVGRKQASGRRVMRRVTFSWETALWQWYCLMAEASFSRIKCPISHWSKMVCRICWRVQGVVLTSTFFRSQSNGAWLHHAFYRTWRICCYSLGAQ